MNTKELLILTTITWIFIGLKSVTIGLFFNAHHEVISIALLVTIGLLHGAFDLHLKIKSSTISLLHGIPRIIPYAISFIILFALSFYFLEISLLIFILISGYHFGEQNLKLIIKKRFILKKTLQLSYGLFILSMLLYLNAEETNFFLLKYTGFVFSEHLLFWSFIGIGTSNIIITLLLILYKQLSIFYGLLIHISLISLYLCFLSSSLLTGFTFYFIVWHSFPSIKDQILNNYSVVHLRTMLFFVKGSLLIWAVSILSLFAVFILMENTITLSRIFLTIGIAGTLPHIFIISRIKNRH